MIKVSDVIRESVNYINDTEHFRVDMEVVDSKVSEEKRISFEVVKLKLPDGIEMEVTVAGQDDNGIFRLIGSYPIYVEFKQDGNELGTINLNNFYSLRKDITFIGNDTHWTYDRCEIILQAIERIPVYRSKG